MSKKTIYLLIGGAVVVIALLVTLSKNGVIGNKDEVRRLTVTSSTIVETVSATGKFNPKLKLNFIGSSEEITQGAS
jgi:HlyD family secretion protein